MISEIKKGKYLFVIRINDFDTYRRLDISVFEESFPAKLDHFFLKIKSEESEDFFDEVLGLWLSNYENKSALEKMVEKFFSLENKRKSLSVKLSIDGLKSPVDDVEKMIRDLEFLNQKMAFIYMSFAVNFDEAQRYVKGIFEDDYGDKADKLQLLDDFKKAACIDVLSPSTDD